VDWCDAYHYCAAVGKRLCGKIGGGSNKFLSGTDAGASQWYRACSAGGVNAYPYGNAFELTYCNASECGDGESLPVATLSGCQSSVSGYTGVYDLSGSVWEWEDSCYGLLGSDGYACGMRGGAFDSYDSSGYAGCWSDDTLACDLNSSDSRDSVAGDLGFRCCSA
jgi:sulfatase modifying factor 1